MQSALPQGHVRYRSSFDALRTIWAQEGLGPSPLSEFCAAAATLPHAHAVCVTDCFTCTGRSGDLPWLHGHTLQFRAVLGVLLRFLRAVQVYCGALGTIHQRSFRQTTALGEQVREGTGQVRRGAGEGGARVARVVNVELLSAGACGAWYTGGLARDSGQGSGDAVRRRLLGPGRVWRSVA